MCKAGIVLCFFSLERWGSRTVFPLMPSIKQEVLYSKLLLLDFEIWRGGSHGDEAEGFALAQNAGNLAGFATQAPLAAEAAPPALTLARFGGGLL
jgi:hypothetical protein